MEGWTDRILAKLSRLREKDTNWCVHGAWDHQFRLAPCLRREEMVELESRYGLRFPMTTANSS
jgi:hypothetical protein